MKREQIRTRALGTLLKLFPPPACPETLLLGNSGSCAVLWLDGSLKVICACTIAYSSCVRSNILHRVRRVQLASLIALDPEWQQEILGAPPLRCDMQRLVQYKVQLPTRICGCV